MNLLQAVQADHIAIRALCREILEKNHRSRRDSEALFSRLANLLNLHTHAEEQVIYDRLKYMDEVRSDVMLGLEEHHMADVLLCELLSLSVDDEHWIAKMEVLRDMLSRHFDVEERNLLPTLKRVFISEELHPMAEAFLAKRKWNSSQERHESPSAVNLHH